MNVSSLNVDIAETNRYLLSASALPLLTAPIVALPFITVAATQVSTSQTAQTQVIYDNKIFSSYDEATSYFLKKNQAGIKKQMVLGNIDNAIIDSTYNMVNKNLLPDYDAATIKEAYRNADGSFTTSIADAKASYANQGLARLQYTFPGAGKDKAWDTAREAEDEAIKGVFNEVLYQARINKPGTLGEGEKILINPTNADDIKNLKRALWAEFKDKPDIYGLAYKETDPQHYAPLQDGWTRGYVYKTNKGETDEITKYDDALPKDLLLNEVSVSPTIINNLFLEYVALAELDKTKNYDNNFSSTLNLSSNKETVETAWHSSGNIDIKDKSYVTEILKTKGSPFSYQFDKNSNVTFKANLTTNIKKFNDNFIENYMGDPHDDIYKLTNQKPDYFIKSYYEVYDQSNANSHVKLYFNEDQGADNNDHLRAAVDPTKESDIRKYQVQNLEELYDLDIDLHPVQEGSDLSKRDITPGKYVSKFNNYSALPPLLPKLLVNKDSVLLNKNMAKNYEVDYTNAYFTVNQRNWTDDDLPPTYIHNFNATNLNNVGVSILLDTRELLKMYGHDFFTNILKTELKNAKQEPLQLGYFYNGKLMFTQNTYEEGDKADVNPVANLKNVSFSYANNHSGAGPDHEKLLALWDLDMNITSADKVNMTDLEKAAYEEELRKKIDRYFTTIVDSSNPANNSVIMAPLDEVEKSLYLPHDEIKQLVSAFREKYETEMKAAKTSVDKITVLKNVAKYDPDEKWLSFMGQETKKGSDDGIPLKTEALIKTYNVATNLSFNLPITAYYTKEGRLINNGKQTVPFIASAASDLRAIKLTAIPKIAKTWTFYNLLGNALTQGQDNALDSSPFDGIDLVASNVKSQANIVNGDATRNGLIDPSKVFVTVSDKAPILVDNHISYIYMLEINKIKKYFDSYDKLEAYALDYIKREALLKN